MSASDAEKLIGVSASTVRTWYQRKARTGLEPADFVRGKPRFRESDLIRLRDGKRRVIRGRPSTAHGELGRKLTAWEAQRVLGIPVSTTHTWWHRRERTKLSRAGLDDRGSTLFFEADLLTLWLGLPLRDEYGERIHTMEFFPSRRG
jgi:transposase